MSKILHFADVHLGAYVGIQCDSPFERTANTRRCLDVVVSTAEAEQPDLILLAGDLFHVSRTFTDRSMIEIKIAMEYLSVLGKVAPVMVLLGTLNHDPVQTFSVLEEHFFRSKFPYVRFFTKPEIITIDTKSGPIQIAGLPGFDKGHFRAQFPGIPAEEENIIFSQQLTAIVEGLSAQLDPEIPSVLMAHHTVVGCELDNGQHVFQANEVVLEAAALDNSRFDLVCLGHIHKAQRVEACRKPVFYSGSIDAFTFNDEGHKHGFWIHNNNMSDFVFTPAREFATERWIQEEVNRYISGELFWYPEKIQNKVVRVLYTCDSETEKALDKKKLERDLYAAGAYYVAEIRPEKVTASVNRERMHESLSVWDCLRKYLTEKNITDVRGFLTAADDIVSRVEASQPAGGQVGIFLPVEISVRNYRSYAEETLSFQDIHFAMVNGVNGSGKSSLFMDALVDCLYEQPREGELTGWIRSGEKSGSISFMFVLGESTYRVTRTRQRSGKATLALAKLAGVHCRFSEDPVNNPGSQEYKWEDMSCERLTDTQEKIVNLLGMDADTFRSCVLIMQDQYGRFMEAKPEDRMSVLASLLGLGMYEQLEGIAKESLRDTNRELKNLKEDASVLEAQLSVLEDARTEEKITKTKIEMAQKTLLYLKVDMESVRTKLAAIENAELELLRADRDFGRKTETRNEKQNKLSDLERNIKATEDFLESETELWVAHTELQELQDELLIAGEQEKRINDKQRQRFVIDNEIVEFKDEDKKLRNNIFDLQNKVEALPAMMEELEQLKVSEDFLKEIEKTKARHDELKNERYEQLAVVRAAEDKYENLKHQAEMLQTVICVDIEKAQCAFLREAKEAAGKIPEAERLKNISVQKLDGIDREITVLNYNPETHSFFVQKTKQYNKLQQDVQACENVKKMIEVHQERLNNIEDTIQKKNDTIQILENELAQMPPAETESIRKKISSLSGQEEQYKQLPAARAYLESAQKQAEDLHEDINTLTAEIFVLQDKKAKLQDGLKNADNVRKSKKQLEENLISVEGDLSGLTKALGGIEEKLRELEGKQEKLQETVKAVNETADRAAKLQVLSEAFGQDGIPHQIIRDIVPELEASANEILGQMTGGRMRLEFRTERQLKSNKAKEVATLDIVIIDIDNGELPYLARSGGQKTRCSLSVIFALAILKASRVGLQLGMLFIDEPAGLDEEGIEGYCKALETIHDMYRDMRIVAISHDERMKARFAQQLHVDVTENGSKVRWE